MPHMNRAYSLLEIKSVNEDERIIEGIATTPTPDRVGDVVDPEGASFTLPMPLLWQHDPSRPIGHVEAAKSGKDGIKFRARIAKGILPYIDEAWALIKAGLVRGVSIGFRSLEANNIGPRDSWAQHFLKWEWMELSVVTIPANAEASITSIKAADAAARAALGTRAPIVRLDAGKHQPGDTGKPSITDILKGTPDMKTIREQIAAFEAKRAANVARMTEIMSKSSDEGRTLDAPETEEYDTLKSEVKAVDDHLTRLRDHESTMKATAVPVAGDDPAGAAASRSGAPVQSGSQPYVTVKSNLPKGTSFTRYAMMLAAAKGNLPLAAEMAKRFKDTTPEVETVLKAAVAAGTTTDANWANPLLPYNDMASEFIELLRPMTIIGRINGFRNVPFNVRMPRQTAGATAGWVGQGAPKPLSKLAFDTVTLPWAKIAVIIALTEELVRFSNPAAEAVCRQDMLDTIAQFMDEQFISPNVAVQANVSPASVTNGVTPVSSTGSTVAAIMSDVQSLFQKFLTAGHSSLKSGHWVMNPRTALYLSMLRTAQDVYAFPGISMQGGTFFGLPVVTSNAVSLDAYGSPSATMIALLDASEILLADDGAVTIDVSREASLQMDSAPDNPPTASTVFVSLWQANMIGLRAERYVHWLKRRSSAAQWISGVTY